MGGYGAPCRGLPLVSQSELSAATKSIIERAEPRLLEFVHGWFLPVSRTAKTTHNNAERRSRQRFRIEEDVCYTCLSGARPPGVGKVLDISSKGVRFTTEGLLKPGTLIELLVSWPARLNDTCPLKLMIYGSVVRSDNSVAAIRIEHYEFRTRASRPSPVLPDPLSHPKGI
jgi:hypothetical protein